jgi:hypothetical protein
MIYGNRSWKNVTEIFLVEYKIIYRVRTISLAFESMKITNIPLQSRRRKLAWRYIMNILTERA